MREVMYYRSTPYTLYRTCEQGDVLRPGDMSSARSSPRPSDAPLGRVIHHRTFPPFVPYFLCDEDDTSRPRKLSSSSNLDFTDNDVSTQLFPLIPSRKVMYQTACGCNVLLYMKHEGVVYYCA